MQFFQNSFNFWPRFGKMHLSFLSENHFRVSVFHHFFKCIMMMEDSRKGAPALSWLKSKSFQKQHLLQMHFIFNDKAPNHFSCQKHFFSIHIIGCTYVLSKRPSGKNLESKPAQSNLNQLKSDHEHWCPLDIQKRTMQFEENVSHPTKLVFDSRSQITKNQRRFFLPTNFWRRSKKSCKLENNNIRGGGGRAKEIFGRKCSLVCRVGFRLPYGAVHRLLDHCALWLGGLLMDVKLLLTSWYQKF